MSRAREPLAREPRGAPRPAGDGAGAGSAALVTLAVLLLLGGALMASLVQTSFGGVDVDVVRFVAADGRVVEGRLHRPRAATVLAPAPGVIAVHGTPSGADALVNLALELSRRGYVVLAIDQPGFGRSDGPVGAGGYGGADALAFVRTLPFVHQERLVLFGHGLGGSAALIGAQLAPDEHVATILAGAAPGRAGAPPADATFPRNLAVVLGRFDEFAEEVWEVPAATLAGTSPRMRALFGDEEPVAGGTPVGAIEAGTARAWYDPPVVHTALVTTGAGIAAVVDWVQRTAPAPAPLAPNDQVWVLRETGAALALAGFALALFGFSGMLLRGRTFARVRGRLAPPAGLTGWGWWAGSLAVAALPAITYVWAQDRVLELVPVTRFTPQPATTAAVGWLLLVGLASLVLVLVWYVSVGRARGAAADTLGLLAPGGVRTVLFAVLVIAASHALLALVEAAFDVRARAWMLSQAAPHGDAVVVVLVYTAPLALAFALWGTAWHALLRPLGARTEGFDATVANALVATGGLLVLVAVQYVAVLGGRPLPFGAPALTVQAVELAALLGLAATLSTYLFARTGSVWPGALTNGAWIAIYLVASRATVAAL